jgi:hypothetical protein
VRECRPASLSDEMFEGAAEAIQLPDDDGVALPCVGQSFGQVLGGHPKAAIEGHFKTGYRN